MISINKIDGEYRHIYLNRLSVIIQQYYHGELGIKFYTRTSLGYLNINNVEEFMKYLQEKLSMENFDYKNISKFIVNKTNKIIHDIGPEIEELMKDEECKEMTDFIYVPKNGKIIFMMSGKIEQLSHKYETIKYAYNNTRCELVEIINIPTILDDKLTNTSVRFTLKYKGKSLDEVFHDEWDK